MLHKLKEILYPSQTIVRTPPANLVPGDEFLFRSANPAHLNEVSLYTYDHVNVTPEGIVFKGLSLDSDLLIYPKHKKSYNSLYIFSSFIKRKKIILPEDSTYLLIFDYWSNSVFHWMCDALPRLEAVKSLAKDCVLLLPENYKYPYIHDSLKAYSFKSIFYVPENAYVSCGKLISPQQITVSGEINPKNMLTQRKTLLDYYIPKFKKKFTYKNIYISRSKAKYRKVLNEETLLPILQKYNFHVIFFEDMDYTEQLECCYNARNAISIHGANLANTLFMQAGGNILELRKNQDSENNYFYAIADSVSCSYYYQNCETIDHVPGENFFDLKVDPVTFEQNIQRMLQSTKDLDR